jgi:exopolysaccharide biosynthesis polyprenyl glycosylphosphotransferase
VTTHATRGPQVRPHSGARGTTPTRGRRQSTPRPTRRNGSRPAAALSADAWERSYRRAVIVGDLLALTIAISLVALLAPSLDVGVVDQSVRISASVTALVLGVGTFVSFGVHRAWEPRVLGSGLEEFRRMGHAVLSLIAVLAIVAFGLKLDSGRRWVFQVLPLFLILALVIRYVLRLVLHRARTHGRYLHTVLACGDADAVADLVRRTRASVHAGWRVDGVCLREMVPRPGGAPLPPRPIEVAGVPVVGTPDEIVELVRSRGYNAVAILPSSTWTRTRTQELAWQLEGSGAEVVLAPVLTDVAGPRLHATPVNGMPLMRVSAPCFSGPRKVAKSLFDLTVAVIALVALGPVLVAIGVAVRLDSRGPALFFQERVGKSGETFRVAKFRTMVQDAEAQMAQLADLNEGAGPLFKMQRDPRITRVGAVLRRFSVDEVPQLLNVITGSMSLVGPRPPLPTEVALYESAVGRRLLVKPGMTGLWQVGGRSDLGWEESVRLDLHYVENWSFALDALILCKTVAAVCRRQGAY